MLHLISAQQFQSSVHKIRLQPLMETDIIYYIDIPGDKYVLAEVMRLYRAELSRVRQPSFYWLFTKTCKRLKQPQVSLALLGVTNLRPNVLRQDI
jgi:hypothetical protein